MTSIMINPWFAEKLSDFLYYCCPECDEKNQSEELFLQHALNEHPNSKECIQRFKIKEEPLEPLKPLEPLEDLLKDELNADNAGDEHSNLEVGTDFLKCEIKKEPENIPEAKIRVRNFICEKCNKAFRDSIHLKEHISCFHERKKMLKCSFCEKDFGYSTNLARHLKIYHNSTISTRKEVKCDFCAKVVYSEKSLLRHIKESHKELMEKKTFKCDSCDQIFQNTNDLRQWFLTFC